MFRANHVLAEMYNTSMQTVLLFFLITCGVAQTISAFTLIVQTETDSVPLLANIFFVAVILQAFLVNLIVYGFGGDFYKASDLSLKRLKQSAYTVSSLQVRDRKHLQRFFKSCQVGKIKFGLSNFIEKTTPPIFQLFCINRIIDLLLLR